MVPERRKFTRFHCFNVGKMYFDKLEEEELERKWDRAKNWFWEHLKLFLGVIICLLPFYLAMLIFWK